ncbi:hypothetical protein N0V88_004331 [Collariella sp. IMI 366227]|nr:hypothetical protein N0V88_004331 [Collariella sp. IMI 366227]
MHHTRQPVAKGPDGAASDLSSFIPPVPSHSSHSQTTHPELDMASASASLPSPPLMHFPHCRLDITTFPPADLASISGSTPRPPQGKLEQIALPGALVRTLLSRFEGDTTTLSAPSSSSSSSSSQQSLSRTKRGDRRIQIQRHFDDNDEWVFSRCLLADFTGFREEDAETLSSQGRLCCWASVVLQPQAHGDGDKWELGFVVQRVGVKDPGNGWCECF